MSFSGEVKKELSKQFSPARHCQVAEAAAIIHYCGRIRKDRKGKAVLEIQTENPSVARKYFTLLQKTFNIYTGAASGDNLPEDNRIAVHDEEQVKKLLMAVKLLNKDGSIRDGSETVNPILIKNTCCQRAFIRGAFLAVGSMSDPRKQYHLELVCNNPAQAGQLQGIIQNFEVEAKIVRRKRYYVVYVKEGAGIVDLLNVMEAHVALMELENLRILKDMRNSINRRVNCEAANITKTVNAAAKQIEDIIKIRDYYGFHNLPPNLREMAEVRLEYPDAALRELGEYLEPPVGKSGVNHRLRKLSEIAEQVKA